MSPSMPNQYPRLLIVGAPFGYANGAGVTLSNLVKGWPRDRVANAALMERPISWDICDRFYRIGDSEFPWLFPFAPIVRPIGSGQVTQIPVGSPQTEATARHLGSVLTPTTRQALSEAASRVLGTTDVIRTVRLSSQLDRWIADFRPQVVLSFFSTLNSMRLVERILRRFHLPNVAFINDDWVSSIYKRGLFSPWLRYATEQTLRRLLTNAGAAVGVSPAMCDTYAQRYGRPFHCFTRPIELAEVLPHDRTNWRAGVPFRLLYAGRIGRANTNSLMDVCKAVSMMRRAGRNVVFDLYLTANPDLIRKTYSAEQGILVHAPIAYEDTPARYAEADLLVLPIDFDEDSKSFARYSMSTKIAEYLASAVPILVYAPAETAMCSYALDDKWGHVVSRRSDSELLQAIVRIVGDESLREALGRRAIQVAQRDHDAAIVRTKFRQLLFGAAQAGHPAER